MLLAMLTYSIRVLFLGVGGRLRERSLSVCLFRVQTYAHVKLL